ncbi:MAG: hypothetical protein IJU95_03990 [Treponema sp.]|nr:hypothetical protein [Treponema sp.]
MKYTICPICESKGTLQLKRRKFSAQYGTATVSNEIETVECSCCGANFDNDEILNDALRKETAVNARQQYITNTLEKLEQNISFTELERCFYLAPKTLSKWKNKSKSPSAAAAALVSLLGVFPWLSYVGMLNYNPEEAYKIAFAAVLQKAKENPENFILPLSNEMYNGIALVHQNSQAYNDSYESLSNNYSENLKSSTIEYKEAVL